MPPAEAGWLARRVAEGDLDGALAVATALAAHLDAPDVTAAEIAQLLEGAERADNNLYARECLPLLQASLRPGITLRHLATWVFGIRYQGLWAEPAGVPAFDRMRADMQRIARALPERTATAVAAAGTRLTSDRFLAVTKTASLADVTRLLEAMSGIVKLSADAAAEIFRQFDPPEDPAAADLYARLIEALAGHLVASEREHVLGSFRDRAVAVMRADPVAVEVTADEGTRTVTTIIMLPPHDTGSSAVPAWDAAPHRSDDQANNAAVAAARRLAAACPEADVVEVVTITLTAPRSRSLARNEGTSACPGTRSPTGHRFGATSGSRPRSGG